MRPLAAKNGEAKSGVAPSSPSGFEMIIDCPGTHLNIQVIGTTRATMEPAHYLTSCESESKTPVDRREGISKAQQDCDIDFKKKPVVLALHQLRSTVHVVRAVSEGDRSGVNTPFTSGSVELGERPFRSISLGRVS